MTYIQFTLVSEYFACIKPSLRPVSGFFLHIFAQFTPVSGYSFFYSYFNSTVDLNLSNLKNTVPTTLKSKRKGSKKNPGCAAHRRQRLTWIYLYPSSSVVNESRHSHQAVVFVTPSTSHRPTTVVTPQESRTVRSNPGGLSSHHQLPIVDRRERDHSTHCSRSPLNHNRVPPLLLITTTRRWK